MKLCGKCGKENQPHYRFCLGCGAELGGDPREPEPWMPPIQDPPAQTRCKHCGGVVPAGSIKCLLCGAPV